MVPLNIIRDLEGAHVPIFVYFPRPVAGVRFPFFTLGKPLWKELRERKLLLPPGSGIIIFMRTDVFLSCLANTRASWPPAPCLSSGAGGPALRLACPVEGGCRGCVSSPAFGTHLAH